MKKNLSKCTLKQLEEMIDDSIKNSKPNREGFIDVMRLTDIVRTLLPVTKELIRRLGEQETKK